MMKHLVPRFILVMSVPRCAVAIAVWLSGVSVSGVGVIGARQHEASRPAN